MHRDEAPGALRRLDRADLLHGHLGALHGHAEVARAVGRLGPVGGVDAGRAVERIDAQAGIVRQRRQAGRLGRREAP